MTTARLLGIFLLIHFSICFYCSQSSMDFIGPDPQDIEDRYPDQIYTPEPHEGNAPVPGSLGKYFVYVNCTTCNVKSELLVKAKGEEGSPEGEPEEGKPPRDKEKKPGEGKHDKEGGENHDEYDHTNEEKTTKNGSKKGKTTAIETTDEEEETTEEEEETTEEEGETTKKEMTTTGEKEKSTEEKTTEEKTTEEETTKKGKTGKETTNEKTTVENTTIEKTTKG